MNAAEVHLMVNHIPVLGTLVVAGLLAYALARDEEPVVRAALWLLVVVGLMGVVTYLTGEPAEEVVEDVVGVSESIIESHQDFALWGLIATVVATLAAVVVLFVRRGKAVGRRNAWLVLVLTLGAFATLSYTAYLGGRINHPEIRSGRTAPEGGGSGDDDERGALAVSGGKEMARGTSAMPAHSARSASVGSTRAARRAGTRHATAAVPRKRTATTP